jgi:1-hydroxycarotenoid 3,4-desaturase
MKARPHVTIIGAGMGGLAAALVLSARGCEVTVLEAGEEAGGKAGTARVEGVAFDTGPSMLTMPHVLDGLLSAAGYKLSEHVGLRRLTPTFRYLYPDGLTLDVHHDLEDTLASVRGALGAEAADDLRQFMVYARQIWDTAAPAFVYADAPSLGSLFTRDLALLPKLPRIDGISRMWGAICKRVRSPQLRTLLARYATYNGSDVRRAPATLSCIAWVEMGLGGFGVEGGLSALAQTLADLSARQGVTFRFNTRVERITTAGERVSAVVTSAGERIKTDAVVANADVLHTLRDLLPEGARPKLPTESSLSMSGWTAVIRAKPRAARTAHAALFPERYLEEFADIFDRGQPPTEPTIYLCDQARAHGRTGWEDGTTPLFAMVNAPPLREGQEVASAATWERVRAVALRRLTAAQLIGPEDQVVWERTPAQLARRFPGSNGSIYGLASNSPWSAFSRPANRFARLPGLYLATGSAHPGGGVPMCLLSGMLAARACLQDTSPDQAHISCLR